MIFRANYSHDSDAGRGCVQIAAGKVNGTAKFGNIHGHRCVGMLALIALYLMPALLRAISLWSYLGLTRWIRSNFRPTALIIEPSSMVSLSSSDGLIYERPMNSIA